MEKKTHVPSILTSTAVGAGGWFLPALWYTLSVSISTTYFSFLLSINTKWQKRKCLSHPFTLIAYHVSKNWLEKLPPPTLAKCFKVQTNVLQKSRREENLDVEEIKFRSRVKHVSFVDLISHTRILRSQANATAREWNTTLSYSSKDKKICAYFERGNKSREVKKR